MKFIVAAIILAQLATARCTQQNTQLEERNLNTELSQIHLGCWYDRPGNRAMTGWIRSYGTVQDCWDFAKKGNYPVFAVENGNECYTAPDAQFTYKKYGLATGECKHWTGGPLHKGWTAMDVFKTNKDFAFTPPMRYASLGCWKDDKSRAISGGIRGGYTAKGIPLVTTVEQCWDYAKSFGYSVFAIQNKIECFTAHNAADTYKTFGRADSDKCRFGGGTRGGYWAMTVYRVLPKYLGCWKDKPERAIAGGIRLRAPSVEACEDYARKRGYSVFALQNDNECFTAHDAQNTYSKYGNADSCFMAPWGYGKGRGGSWGMDVYKIYY